MAKGCCSSSQQSSENGSAPEFEFDSQNIAVRLAEIGAGSAPNISEYLDISKIPVEEYVRKPTLTIAKRDFFHIQNPSIQATGG